MHVADLLTQKNTAPLITVKATDSLKEAIKKLERALPKVEELAEV